MNDEDVALFRQAEQIANGGQGPLAHQIFCNLRVRNPEQVEVLFWVATTSSDPVEARQAIDTVRRLQPYHPRLPELEAFHTKKQRYAIRTRILSSLYIGAVAFIIIRDIPKGTFNTLNTLVIIYVVLFNTVLSVNIARLAIKRVVFTKLSALYIAALAGLIMALSTGNPTGAPLAVFGLSILYIGVYTIVLAIRGVLTGRV